MTAAVQCSEVDTRISGRQGGGALTLMRCGAAEHHATAATASCLQHLDSLHEAPVGHIDWWLTLVLMRAIIGAASEGAHKAAEKRGKGRARSGHKCVLLLQQQHVNYVQVG